MKAYPVIPLLLFIFLQGCAWGQPKENNPKTDTVYVTNTGTKYHSKNCRYLKSSISISLSSALQRGYLPCSVCGPPTSSKTTNESQEANQADQGPRVQPLSAPVKTTPTQASQCMAFTKSGLRCKRTTTSSSGKCWQHE